MFLDVFGSKRERQSSSEICLELGTCQIQLRFEAPKDLSSTFFNWIDFQQKLSFQKHFLRCHALRF